MTKSLFGWQLRTPLVRKTGTLVPDHEAAILDLQDRVAKLQNQVGVKAKTAQLEEASQDEIQKVLQGTGTTRPAEADLWAPLR